MENSILIRKVHMNCPLCDKMHEIEERKRTTSITIKGEEVFYEERFYFCANADEDENEFETAAMTNENLLNARNAYRVKMGLLTSTENVALRESYGLSQVDLAKLLGWGEATISRYESKAIQDEAYDTMLRLIKDNPLQALEFLKKNADKFTMSKRVEIRSHIVDKLDSYGKEFLTRQTFESEYANFEEPSDSNGFTMLNIEKIEAMISYIAEKTDNLFKVKLMKMLWYSDVLAFIENGLAMTGMVYRHEAMGALPVGHYSLMNLEKLNIQEEMLTKAHALQHLRQRKFGKNHLFLFFRVIRNINHRKTGHERRADLALIVGCGDWVHAYGGHHTFHVVVGEAQVIQQCQQHICGIAVALSGVGLVQLIDNEHQIGLA